MSINKTLFILATVGLLVACQRQLPSEQEKNESLNAVKIPSYSSNGLSAYARLKGPLQLKGNCLYVNDTLIIFPDQSAQWDDQNHTLTYKGKKITLGEELDIAGGFGQLGAETRPVKNLSSLCDQQSLWFAG
ncbi:hypothetical protein KTJ32_07420 [Acinetobacter gyllenbergii]|uniref:hypothetical protein n=1 Tax=Acinetobacter gyllenbergii TaxID=134534 RepID=UPI00370992F6|nr:hypothetical protein [Acinetobacter gyllenbergii]